MSAPLPFIELLTQRIAGSGISGREFARRIGMEAGTLSAIKAGKSRFPIALSEKACRALALTDEQAKEFDTALHLAHSTDKIREEYEQLRQQVKAAGDTAAYVRAHACQIHAHEIGRPLPIAEYAKKHNIPFNDLIQFNLTGEGSAATTMAMAKIYGVSFAWLAGDGDDPDWYADLLQRCMSFGPAWQTEAARALKRRR